MSYKCQICRQVVKNGQSRITHRLMRDRTMPNGTVVKETAAEVPICSRCEYELVSGEGYRSLVHRHMPKIEEITAPEYKAGETTTFVTAVVLEKAAELVVEEKSALPVGFLYALFQRYGAVSYWQSKYAEADPQVVADEIAQHWHLRKLWGKIHDLVPLPRRKYCRKPEPNQPVIRPIPVEAGGVEVVLCEPEKKSRK